jgi:tRNA(fMet)-specific endonuclease VapC
VALLIDTSVLIDAERGGGALQQVPKDEQRMMSVITVSELLHGVHRAVVDAVRIRRLAIVEDSLSAVEPIPITTEIARIHARSWGSLEAAGEIIGMHDLWIAATALAHGLQVATTNAREFERVPGLSVLAL